VATLAGHSDPVTSVAFHPTAPLLATGSWDNTVKLWNYLLETEWSRVVHETGATGKAARYFHKILEKNGSNKKK
jgi:WD40 repeat protein